MNVNILSRPARSAWEEAKNPLSYGRGDDFQRYIRDVLLPRDAYDLLYKTNDFTEELSDYVTYSKLPEFKFKSKPAGIEIFIDGKFRSKFQDQITEWCKLFQLKRWQEIDHVTPVVVIAGLGGRPSSPGRVFMMPVKHLKFVKLYPGFMQKYEIRPDRAVTESYVRRILEIQPG